MTITAPSLSKKRGFTLIELLVVIVIIAVLAGLGFAGFNSARQAAKKTAAGVAMGELVKGTDAYFDEYSELPLGKTSSADDERNTDNEMMAVLLGLKSAAEENYKELSFVAFQKAKGKGSSAHNGLERNDSRAELFGPWLNKVKSDRYYRMVLNYDYDDELEEPSNVGSETHYETRVLVYHMGKDGKSGSAKNDKDNVYSWAKSK